MAKQSPRQKKVVERVMHEFKQGELESGSGRKVRNPKQAIAIALHEAGASRDQTPKQKSAARSKSGAGERRGATATAGAGEKSKADLYAEATRRNLPGRSKMNKDELARALRA